MQRNNSTVHTEEKQIETDHEEADIGVTRQRL